MLLTIAALVVGIAIGLATGGKVRYAAHRQIRWWSLIAVGFGLQIAADHWLSGALGYVALVGGPLCLLAWAARNARLAGVGIVAVGILANLAVLAVDHGMPVERSALVKAGIVSPSSVVLSVSGHRHHLAHPGDHLRFLDDRIALPLAQEVASIGDLVLALGVVDLVVHLLWYEPRYQRVRPRPRWMRPGALLPGGTDPDGDPHGDPDPAGQGADRSS